MFFSGRLPRYKRGFPRPKAGVALYSKLLVYINEFVNINISLLAPSYVRELKSLTQKTPMKNLITTSKSIAFMSFIIGTILFTLKLYNPYLSKLTIIGALFVIVALAINSILLFGLVFKLCFGMLLKTLNHETIIQLATTIGIVLANIPIAILYFYILIESL